MGIKVTTMGDYLARKQAKMNGTLDAEVIKSEREVLFDELDAKGISYKKNAKTKDLEKLLEGE